MFKEKKLEDSSGPSGNPLKRIGLKFKERLSKSRENLRDKLEKAIGRSSSFSDDFFREFEEILIQADVGVEASAEIVDFLRQKVKQEKVKQPDEIFGLLEESLGEILQDEPHSLFSEDGLSVILIVGVNGTGKTTTIAKITKLAQDQGKKVLLAAADTYRAAAIEQLEVWAARLKVEVVKHQRGGDAAAVVYDACQAALARGVDALLVDTAGRLHTQTNLMEELKKIKKVASKTSNVSIKTLLVLDATTGQNAIFQAQLFDQALDLDGIVLTKLDGTAKGGIVVAIKRRFGIPISLVGVGEKIDDILVFNASLFAQALLEK